MPTKRETNRGFTKGGTKSDWVKAANIVARNSAVQRTSDSRARSVVTMGWQPDVPDFRDLNLRSPKIEENLKKSQVVLASKANLPPASDLRRHCSPIEDQGSLGSCTAQAVVGLMEYMMRRGMDDHVDGSRLFVYKVTRELMGLQGDTGASLRASMKAVAAFGVPPEEYWPYEIGKFEEQPSAFLYSFAQNFKALDYTRLDPPGTSGKETLENVLGALAAGFPVAFGFSVYSSLGWDPDIPFPHRHDVLQGGHAVLAVGYDMKHVAVYYDENGEPYEKEVPSLLIRNSWGPDWGEGGYGYLPMEYLTYGLASDFWTCFKWEWLNTQRFG